MPRKLILDVDTGTDDAVAIMLAALHPELELVGVTTVNGNVEVRYCTDNSLRWRYLRTGFVRLNACLLGKTSSGDCCFVLIASLNYTTHSRPWSIR
jgi:hypothetical protein